ncbi:MAG: hypothetical protein IT427_15085 [Pirellulales bacterium]|nr:hypothetical protein [Pirellulales bacterium]
MTQRRLASFAVVLGLVLILLSLLWPSVAGGRRAWTSADAEQFQAATLEYHQLKYQYHAALSAAKQQPSSTGSPSQRSPQNTGVLAEAKNLSDRFAQVEERYLQLNDKLERAKSGGQNAATAMRWAGIAIIAVGALGLYSARATESK